MHPQRHALWNAQGHQMPLAALAQQWADRDLDHSWFISDEAADRIDADVPAR